MTKPAIPQSQKRHTESLAPLFILDSGASVDLMILKSSSDAGVIRNGGRNGARLAPQSFMAYFKKLNQTDSLSSKKFLEVEVADQSEEQQDFIQAQLKQSERISKFLKQNTKAQICHLGGGHDHIYPLLRSLGENYPTVIVINIDAHADTRTDTEPHSGTPFRQFAQEYQGSFHLFQLGLHKFANSLSTISPLSKGQSYFLWQDDLLQPSKVSDTFEHIQSLITDRSVVVFSLDADALNGAEMPGVSAVNGHGISRQQLSELAEAYKRLKKNHASVLGIYELNPVYDTLSALSIRSMATFLYENLA